MPNPLRHALGVPVVAAGHVMSGLRLRRLVARNHRRTQAFGLLGRADEPAAPERLVVVVTHVVASETARPVESAERLSQTLSGVFESFAHTELVVIVNTVAGRSVCDRLPEWQRRRVSVRFQEGIDPVFITSRAPAVFDEHRGSSDWFMVLEDDIVVRDSSFLAKVAWFNSQVGDARYLLMPNRYEMVDGRKTYIDNHDWNRHADFGWNRFSQTAIGGIEFAEPENPHAGSYCLSRAQLDHLLSVPRAAPGNVVYEGPLESSVTGVPMEAFVLVKPTTRNSWFLEVRHWDSKYTMIIDHAIAEASRNA